MPNCRQISFVLNLIFLLISMEALDSILREKSKEEKLRILEERRKRLSDMLLMEAKKYEVKE